MQRDRMATGLLVISIMAVLAASILPRIEHARQISQSEDRNRKCISNLRRIGQAFLIYAQEHSDGYPPDLATLVTSGYFDRDTIRCPVAMHNGGETAYIYHRPDLPFSRTPPDTLIVEDSPAHTDEGSNVLFADGHSVFLTTSELRAARHPPAIASTRP